MALSRLAALQLLSDRSAVNRRRAAKRLITEGHSEDVADLQNALNRELQDSRTWEVQYHLIRAIGTLGSAMQSAFLRELAGQPREATVVNLAIGEALVRLEQDVLQLSQAVDWCVSCSYDLLGHGSIRGLAIGRLVPLSSSIDAVTQFVIQIDRQRVCGEKGEDQNDVLAYWFAMASAGWGNNRAARNYARILMQDERDFVREAAIKATSGTYPALVPGLIL